VRILALDTATENCSAALLIDGRLRALEAHIARGHAERILPMVDELLRAAAVPLTALTAIAFGRGPGSFTGVRLAASVAQGLAFGARLPVVPVSDLRAIAQRALELPGASSRVLVCSDARMQEVYWGCFERGVDGLGFEVTPERVGPAATVKLPVDWEAGERPWGAGTGFMAYAELAEALGERLSAVHKGLLPRAEEIARLAVVEAQAGRLFEPEQALPVYLRDDVAEPPPGVH
jgi:tRNA threonylcarbamoyladenosine biosynthesis protein TsaB